MEKRLANPYARLTEYYRVFKAYDCSELEIDDESLIPMVTIALLSEKLGIPLNIMRMDITNIMRYSDGGILDFNIDEDIDLDIDYEALSENPDMLFDMITAGLWDNVPLNFYDTFVSDCSVFLSEEEIAALDKTGVYELPFFIKDNEFKMTNVFGIMEMIEIVEKAMSEKRSISFKYFENKKLSDVSIIPLKIVYDEGDYSILTCVDGIPKSYFFSEIKCGILIGEPYSMLPGSAYMSILPQVWGLDFMAEPYLVEVKFYDEGDVFNRVRAELSARSMGQLYEEDGFLIYEDTVYGLDSFKAWILSFGSSAVVVKPKALREEIISELKACLED